MPLKGAKKGSYSKKYYTDNKRRYLRKRRRPIKNTWSHSYILFSYTAVPYTVKTV